MILSKIKQSMRISHNRIDDDIISDVDTAKLDMTRLGIDVYKRDADGNIEKIYGEEVLKDNLVYKCIEFFVKWQADYMGHGDKYEKAYKDLSASLSLSGKYIEVVKNEE